jgi:four helix bundle protein
MHQALENLEVYRLAEKLSDDVWAVVVAWDYFARNTVGKQLVEAADSIASNISEGYGRFSYKENIRFCYYSRGSLFETKNWLRRAKNRSLINSDVDNVFSADLDLLGKKLNAYINSIKKKTHSDHEP